MLNDNALSSLEPVFTFLPGSKFFQLWGLMWNWSRSVQSLNTEIAQISKQHGSRINSKPVLFEQPEVVIGSPAKWSAHDLPCLLIDDHLCFDVMMLVLAGIPTALLFLGRSMVLSVTSTTSASNRVSVPYNALFFGREKLPEPMSVSSTRLHDLVTRGFTYAVALSCMKICTLLSACTPSSSGCAQPHSIWKDGPKHVCFAFAYADTPSASDRMSRVWPRLISWILTHSKQRFVRICPSM